MPASRTDDSGPKSDAHVDARQRPFYEWLDNSAIRDLVLRGLELPSGEILVLIKGLVPTLVAALGIVETVGALILPTLSRRTVSQRRALRR